MVQDAAATAFYATIARLTELSPGMFLRQGDTGTRIVYTGLPTATLNVVAVDPGSDPSEVDAFALPALLDAPDTTSFVLEEAGEAVATGQNMHTGDHVGMYCGSVRPNHRGHGYYRALVAARLRHAVAAGARHAFTQNSPMSRPLFESFGFQLAETWTYLKAAGDA